jgi:tetratricopeptide (TPR) repeat protein
LQPAGERGPAQDDTNETNVNSTATPNDLESRGKLGDAIVETTRLEHRPTSAPQAREWWKLIDLGRALIKQKNYEKAIAEFTEVIRINSESTDSYVWRGVAQLRKAAHDEAIADFTEAIRRDPKLFVPYIGRGFAWLNKRLYDKAISDFDGAIRINPYAEGAFRGRGLAGFRKSEFDKAIADFSEAIRLGPEAAVAIMERRLTPATINKYENGVIPFDDPFGGSSDWPALYYNRGLSWSRQYNFENAIADYNKALEAGPALHEAYNALAFVRATCPIAKFRDGKKAIELATTACELTGWNAAETIGTLAASHAESGEFDQAVKMQTRAIGLLTDAKDKADFHTRLELYRQKMPYRQILPK